MLSKLLKKYINAVKDRKEKIVYDISTKILFVGDIHGDIETALKIEEMVNNYDKIIFLGDYVDRGNFGYEVLIKILNLYFQFPNKIVLLKGNHEDLEMNYYYGFYQELLNKEPESLYILEDFYNSLSLIYINNYLKVFAVHGGIGLIPKTIEDLLESENDLLWSDFNWENPVKTTFNYYRGAGKIFGLDILKPFMEKFGFRYFVRAHEYFEDGYRVFNFDNKYLITIFSSNANGYFFVKKKLLEINEKGFKVKNI